MKAVLDPGHGGTAKIGGSSPNNAVGPGGLLEKTVTLEVARIAQQHLVALGADCVLTRDSDNNFGLAERAHVARDARADAFVSIHFNASKGHNAQGTETWLYAAASPWSRSLAATVQAGVFAATVDRRDRGVKTGAFRVLNPAYHLPSTGICLVEMSFMDRAEEEERLRDAGYRERLGSALATAVHGWLIASRRDRAIEMRWDEEELWAPEDGFEILNGPDEGREPAGPSDD